ncbi:MAG: two-component system, sensor histidine kinase and response regulator [Candidatus Binatota bacterium]|jgi:signal transduction histidine kinase/CheY-like chemotaxis protein|nr:two-component system, sensor histidine kinase and response regulator [Candidatus Binatota bacterium]
MTSANPERAAALLAESERKIWERTDRIFALLMIIQWVVGIAAALWISPRTWRGAESTTHVHVWAAIFLGGAISSLPVVLALTRPGRPLTRHVIAVGQMLTSALLIHLSGGRIETHFHVFGSLAFLAFYRDWKVLMTGSAIVAADHYLRGAYWPQSVYGVLSAEPWRWLEHAGWVVFEDVFLIIAIRQARVEMAEIAERHANLESVNEKIESEVLERTVELRDSEAALRVALAAAKESERLKTEFLASMSHELRTPLNGVIGMTGLLMDTPLTPEQREFTETARVSADTLLDLINDVLDFSKAEAGRLEIETVTFDLESLAADVVELFGAQAAQKGIDVVLRYAPETPASVRGDAGRIRQVLTNLVGNAVKFTEAGHVFLNVECGHQDGRLLFHFSVEDTGIGIAGEKLHHVFDRFTQADSSTTRRYGGTGLGLAISKQIVELMGGTIGVVSMAGRGSTFSFTLPLEISASAPRPSLPTADVERLRIAVVDDNEVNRRLYQELLTRWAMRCSVFASGPDAIAALRVAKMNGDPFQMAIIDMHMPGMDGDALGRAIKSDAALHDIVLLLFTSAGRPGDTKRMTDAGFAAYLTKPVRPTVLLDAIQTAWGARDVIGKEGVLITRHDLAARDSLSTGKPETRSHARVLVVEDNPVNQRVARLMLERIGCRVDVAGNGREAIALFEKVPYEIVLMDCQMPEMDGYEATAEIRQMESAGSRIPIIAMTAHTLQGAREKCLAAGMDDYIGKPVRPESLYRTIDKWVRFTPGKEAPASRTSASDAEALEPQMASFLQSLEADAGEEVVRELVTAYVDNTRSKLSAMRRAVAAGDLDGLAAVLHDVKGASATVGAQRLAELCRELETALRAGAASNHEGAVAAIEEAFRRLDGAVTASQDGASAQAASTLRPDQPI